MIKTKTLRHPPTRLWAGRAHEAIHVAEGEFPDLAFLGSQATTLKELSVTTLVGDVSAISQLSRLEKLTLWPLPLAGRREWSVDLSGLRGLRELSIGRKVEVDVAALIGLESLHVDGMTRTLASHVEQCDMSRLTTLRLDSPLALPRHIPENVRELSIARVKHWENVHQFAGLSGLKYLQVEDIRGMTDFRAFESAPPIDRLYVEDCPELISLAGLSLVVDAEYAFVGRVPLRSTMGSRWTTPEV